MTAPSRRGGRRLAAMAVLPFLLAACPRARPAGGFAAARAPASVGRLLAEHPIGPGEAVKVVEAGRTGAASFHLVQVAARERPHRHARHDLTVLVLRGRGTLFVDGLPHPLAEGGVFHIPRGAPHHFVNEADGPSAAWATFTPPFDGADVVPVPAEAGR